MALVLTRQGLPVLDLARYPGIPAGVPLGGYVLADSPPGTGEVQRGVAICGSGVGASVAANKVPGVRAGLIHDVFSAHQGVENDDMSVSCLVRKVIGSALAWELIETFLAAHFSGVERHKWRLKRVRVLESQKTDEDRVES